MDMVLYNAIKTKIDSLNGLNFQDFINKLYLIYHGNKFETVKQKKDEGCDGIINNETIVAVYAPEKLSSKFKVKIKDDYQKYKNNWSNKYSKWQIVYNREFTAGMVQFVKALKNDAELTDINRLMEMIDKFNWRQKRDIAKYLSIDEGYFVYDVLEEIVDDLIKGIKKTEVSFTYEKPFYIEDKIKLNYSQDDIDSVINEYNLYLENDFKLLMNVLSGRENDISTLKSKIINDYDKYHAGNFKSRLEILTDLYTQKNKNDDEYKKYVRVILLYCFEQCLIGKKTNVEGK